MTAQETSAKENNTDVKQTATTPVLIYQRRQHCLYINFKKILGFCWLHLHIYSLFIF